MHTYGVLSYVLFVLPFRYPLPLLLCIFFKVVIPHSARPPACLPSLILAQFFVSFSTGSAKGGDCDHLLLASSPEKFIQIRAHGGDILIDGTHVESWDLEARGVDEDYDDGRRCVPDAITQHSFFCFHHKSE